MRSFSMRSSWLALVLTPFVLSACAPAGFGHLPDEVTDESSAQTEYAPNPDQTLEGVVVEAPRDVDQAAVVSKYQHLDPQKQVPTDLLKTALSYYDANPSRFPNKNFITIVDFAAHSSKPRFFIINMKSGAVQAYRVAHGKNSDKDNDGYAESFSNENNSNQSSLGVYRASEPYQSAKFGYSMRLDGLSTTNSRVRARAVVIHPASYVYESNTKPGRTWGCFGLAKSVSKSVVDQLKNGSMIYAGLAKK